MNLWLAAILGVFCALAGVVAGRWFSRLRSPWWTIGYFLPLVLVFAYAFAFRVPGIAFIPPFSWMLGMKKFALFGFVATMVLTTPLSRVPRPRDRVLIASLMAVIAFATSVCPYLAPLFDRAQLRQLHTKMD